MRAFEVYLNDQRLCLAGIGDDGVLTAIIDYVTGAGRQELRLEVGGLITPQGDHVRWRNPPLRVGDEVRVKIVESTSVDRPTKRHRRNPSEELKAKKHYVRQMAKEFGWKIETRRKTH